jgi:hypothetical protein
VPSRHVPPCRAAPPRRYAPLPQSRPVPSFVPPHFVPPHCLPSRHVPPRIVPPCSVQSCALSSRLVPSCHVPPCIVPPRIVPPHTVPPRAVASLQRPVMPLPPKCIPKHLPSRPVAPHPAHKGLQCGNIFPYFMIIFYVTAFMYFSMQINVFNGFIDRGEIEFINILTHYQIYNTRSDMIEMNQSIFNKLDFLSSTSNAIDHNITFLDLIDIIQENMFWAFNRVQCMCKGMGFPLLILLIFIVHTFSVFIFFSFLTKRVKIKLSRYTLKKNRKRATVKRVMIIALLKFLLFIIVYLAWKYPDKSRGTFKDVRKEHILSLKFLQASYHDAKLSSESLFKWYALSKLKFTTYESFYKFIILLSGDISLNPGPSKYPCSKCNKSVRVGTLCKTLCKTLKTFTR